MPVSRREVLARIATAAMMGPITAEAAQHVHESAAAATTGGVYKPKALTQHEFDTLKMLCEIIVPGAASKGGATEFIDLLSSQNPEMMGIYTGGIAWIDEEMRRQYHAEFLAAKDDQRKALLDVLAFTKNRTEANAPGIKFFAWARRMTVDAYYTSAAGMKEVGYMGNRAIKEFHTPQDAIDYAIKHSPFA